MGVLEKLNQKVISGHVPFSCVFELTYRCNLHCEYCYISRGSDELGYDDVTKILDSIASAGTMFLTLTGGEVFMRGDFLKIVRYARLKGFILRIFTNGTLITDEALDLFKKLSGVFLSVSIHGRDEFTNDGFTKVAGSFKKAVGNVKKCREMNIPVRLKCTWTERNISQYRDILGLAGELGVPLSGSLLFSPKSDGSFSHVSCMATEEKMRELLRSEYGSMEDFEGFYDRAYSDADKARSAAGERNLCSAGVSLFRIDPAGNVFPCVLMHNSLGNLKESDFAGIWEDNEFLAELRELKRKDVRGCSGCEDFNYCFRCPGIAQLEGGDIHSTSTEACRKARLRKDVIQQLRAGA